MKIYVKNSEKRPDRIRRVFATTKISAGTNNPKGGIFWVIDDELVVVSDNVNTHGSECDDILHINAWKSIKNQYKVDGKAVKYDYFPRGRVMVMPIWNNSGEFDHYDCYIYGDKCIIDEPEIQDEIEDMFRLYLNTCKVIYEGQLSIDGTHYTCHMCR
ncbi:MAG: hypothetical protein NC320_03155 [Clostridium sp.]|nr:hypothetical protein [Clostridium sp.]